MFCKRSGTLGRWAIGAGVLLLVGAGTGRAGDTEELRRLVEEQGRQIQALKAQLEARAPQTENQPPAGDAAKAADGKAKIDDEAVKKIVSDYLKDNPGAGMPSGVQTGYTLGQGFTIRSTPDPRYANWTDDSKIPFELRFRGRIQLDYYRYKVTDTTNHLTNRPATQDANATRQADFSQLEVKRLRLIWEGTAFDPNLRFNFTLDGNTRGLGGFQNNRVLQTTGGTDPNASPASVIGGGVTIDHSVRLFEGWVAYDFHPCWWEKGCGPDCPEGTVKYAPTFTIIAGKLKPFFGLEEILGSLNEQMVEYSMADWFFDADDDNLMTSAGFKIKALDDRLYVQGMITNGNESQFPNTQMDDYPGFQLGFWYDFGGSWNEDRKRWDLFGDCLSDIDYSCHPVVRVGAESNIVPMDRRSLYGDEEPSRVFVVPGGPQGGTRLINVLNGDGAAATPLGSHDVDKFDSYSVGSFIALKYRGFSLWNEWYLRDLNDFRTTPNGRGNIIYTDTAGNNALFPHHALLDYGSTLQGGYFVVPKKLELVARWSFVRGESGAENGNGTFHTVTVPGVTGPVRVYNEAFRVYHEADEYAVGVNYYFKRQLLKWQTDFSWYEGGNPAGGGQSAAGFIAGSDGWLLRTQIQLAF
jgi:hypothetical protein